MPTHNLPFECEKLEGVISNRDRQYYLYEAEVPAARFPRNKGDVINKYESIKEINDKSGLDVVNETVLNTEWRKRSLDHAVRSVSKTLSNPYTYVKLLTKMLSAASPHSKTDPFSIENDLQEKMKDILIRQHEENVIEPRSKRAYLLEGDISITQMQGSEIEHLINENQPPYDFVKVWIVSDMTPEEIENNGGITPGANSYVCVDEKNALILAKQIKDNSKECMLYLKSESFNVKPTDDTEFVVSSLYNFVLLPVNQSLKELIDKYKSDVEKYNTLRATHSSPVPVEIYKKDNLVFEEYPHFQQVEYIYQQFNQIINFIESYRSNLSQLDVAELNTKLKDLDSSCKKYVEQHPYKSQSTDPVFDLMSRLEKTKQIVVDASEKLIKRTAKQQATVQYPRYPASDPVQIPPRPPVKPK